MTEKIRIAVAKGDGIGPEIMEAVLNIFDAASVPLEYDFVEMGLSYFKQGFSSGMTPLAKETVEKHGLLFKGPMETPKGKGVKSINVTARKTWSTYANRRHFKSLHGVETVFSKAGVPVDITIVRENIEDTYGGIEHQNTHDVALCRRFITRPGSEQVHRFAFEMARREGFTKVACGHKANIMKLTDGLFLETFYEVAKEYPDIKASDVIVDDLAMKLVARPNMFQVVVLPNLQGDIISDLCAGLVGGLGFAPSANIGDNISIFEAVHGTAPDIAGQNIANPTSLLLSGLMMLRHLGIMEEAAMIENALLHTLEQGVHTADFGDKKIAAVNTTEFSKSIIENFDKQPKKGKARETGKNQLRHTPPARLTQPKLMQSPLNDEVRVNGVDLFVGSELMPNDLADLIQSKLYSDQKLVLISNRGTQVWPTGSVYTECINHYRVRIESKKGVNVDGADMMSLCSRLAPLINITSVETLYLYGDKKGYSLAQGQ